jgi:glycosyltransferase involved in cell wall biosynthesis
LLTVTKLWDKRKNTSTLIRIVGELSSTLPESRLVVKADPEDRLPPKGPENVIFVRELLTDGQMNALLSTADVYVSAHHSEGWGLPLSDAMSFNLPVIATG